ncbi:ABC transporter permease [Ammoniphilus oxalaticus]|uniref:Probable heme-iron transport system permease protein IsdF n=1 Tax=Ammoniphilus oxalaticus TaxID=66863 RepID=A0A419SGL2_9BACL|nr:iron ABC transporter permease [Ammoniphilus oxalaticus]RKD22927.1 ABC transporter permease [Ammoniphilus oxalaticus]
MKRGFWSFFIVIILTIIVFVSSAASGSLEVTVGELVKGLITGDNEKVNIIKDLRFPRLIVALVTGAALAVSGVLLQAVMKNPLAEAGIIGISAGGRFLFLLVMGFFPQLFFWTPLFAFLGGALACFLVFSLSWKSGLSPLRIILVGIAVNATFTGLNQSFIYFVGSSSMTHATVSNFAMKTWGEAQVMMVYGLVGLTISLFLATWCNLLSLEDKTAKNLGFNVTVIRLLISAVAVLLAAVTAAIAGVIAFVGLLIPHIGRILVGTDHKALIPFSALSGALLILLADTIGRLILPPNDIPASVMIMVIGGPFLIFLLRRSERFHGN